MTFEEFKAEFDSTIGAMSPDEVSAALKAAGIDVSDGWSAAYSEADCVEGGCPAPAANSNELALAA